MGWLGSGLGRVEVSGTQWDGGGEERWDDREADDSVAEESVYMYRYHRVKVRSCIAS